MHGRRVPPGPARIARDIHVRVAGQEDRARARAHGLNGRRPRAILAARDARKAALDEVAVATHKDMLAPNPALAANDDKALAATNAHAISHVNLAANAPGQVRIVKDHFFLINMSDHRGRMRFWVAFYQYNGRKYTYTMASNTQSVAWISRGEAEHTIYKERHYWPRQLRVFRCSGSEFGHWERARDQPIY